MKSPYQILDVSEDADDALIKKAYLLKIKAHPPEHNQEMFLQIQNAYQTVKDTKSRARYALFNIESIELNEFLQAAFCENNIDRVEPGTLAQLLNQPVDYALVNKTLSKTRK